MPLFTIKYAKGVITLLDQTGLPGRAEYLQIDTVRQVCRAIRDMQVRGAPAIGVCAAYGMCIAARQCAGDVRALEKMGETLRCVRPTAANLSWAVGRMMAAAKRPGEMIGNMEAEADAIAQEDAQLNRRIGEHLLGLLPQDGCILTHCNAGALATSAYGTALSPIYLGLERGQRFSVIACETRPLLQGARLTAYELHAAGVPVTVICDNNAANVLRQGRVDAVITGCDRVAANGDAANKIGTFGLSVLARHFHVPFYVAAPTPTIDFTAATGDDIMIEQRDGDEVACYLGCRTVPRGVPVENPAFDVTPACNITAIITEKGVFSPEQLGRIAKRGVDE